MSVNNQFEEHAHNTVRRYRLADRVSRVSGLRLDPTNNAKRLDWLLKINLDHINEDGSTVFDYGTQVIELYSDLEAQVFESLNRAIFERGYLVPHNDGLAPLDKSNVVDSPEIAEIISIRNHLQYRSRLEKITSLITLGRIKAALTDEHKQWYYKYVDERIAALQNDTANQVT